MSNLKEVTGAFALIDSLVKHKVSHIFVIQLVLFYLFMMIYIIGNKIIKLHIFYVDMNKLQRMLQMVILDQQEKQVFV